MAYDFVKTLTNMRINFLFISMNIRYPKSALIANKSISVSYDATSIFDGISRALLKM